MIYTKNQEIKARLLTNLNNKHIDINPETLMDEANELNLTFGYFNHKDDDSIYLILNNDLIYLDSEAEIIKTKGSYKEFEDIMSGVTKLGTKMMDDLLTILSGSLDILCLGNIDLL